jgi:hypothetical protein
VEKAPEVAPQPQKYNHTQFHTVSGTRPKEDEQFISFDNLVKGNEPAKQPNHHVHNNILTQTLDTILLGITVTIHKIIIKGLPNMSQ